MQSKYINSIKYISLLLIVLISIGMYFTYETELKEPDLEKNLKSIATKNYLETNILSSLKNGNHDDTNIYLNIANYLKVEINEDIKKEIEENNDFLSKSLRNTKDFSKGFIYGESDNSVGFMGSMASDFTTIGDIRDITKEGNKFVQGQEYDKVVMGIAILSIGITTSQVLSAGSTTPFKIGASIVKFSKKAGKLSKSFINIISSKITKSIDFTILKKIDYTDVNKVKESVVKLSKTTNFKEVNKIFNNIGKLKKNTSVFDTVFLLKYVDKPKDLTKILKLSKKFGKNTKGVLKILGKGALKAGKIVTKYTTLFIVELISLFSSIILFIFAFFSKLFFFKRII